MSFKPEFQLPGQEKWSTNALRFATREEAEDYASALFLRWTAPKDYRVAECDDPVNYAIVDGILRHTGD